MGFARSSSAGMGGGRDAGLLLIRLGIGLSILVFHGYGKITAGPQQWGQLGTQMGHLGIHFLPVFWGFMAALAESLCSVLLILGVLFRPAAALLAVTMLVASARHLSLPPGAEAAGWKGASHALELLAVYLGLLLTGAGRYALTTKWRKS